MFKKKLHILENLCCIAVDAVGEYLVPTECTSAEYVERHFSLCAAPLALLHILQSTDAEIDSKLLTSLSDVPTAHLHQYLVCVST